MKISARTFREGDCVRGRFERASGVVVATVEFADRHSDALAFTVDGRDVGRVEEGWETVDCDVTT